MKEVDALRRQLKLSKSWIKEKDARIKVLEKNLSFVLDDKRILQEKIKTLSENEKIIIHFIRKRNKDIKKYKKLWKKQVKNHYKLMNWQKLDILGFKSNYINFSRKDYHAHGLKMYYKTHHNEMYKNAKATEPIKYN